jgi:hypothetical protein
MKPIHTILPVESVGPGYAFERPLPLGAEAPILIKDVNYIRREFLSAMGM